ncbi:MAG: hypothetical protein F4Y02_00635 [Chloroflexi bacterium]|nr:hypothetical protein [Chloroflexota bacterium]
MPDPGTPGASAPGAVYRLECRHSAWRSLGICAAVFGSAAILTQAVAIGIALLTIPPDFPLRPDGSLAYHFGVGIGLAPQYTTDVGLLASACAWALAGFLLIRSVFRKTAIVATAPGAAHPVRYELDVEAPVRRFGWPITLAAAGTLCTLGGALAYYLPWCVGAVARTATGRAPAPTGAGADNLAITCVLDRAALAKRAALPGVAITVAGAVYITAWLDLQEVLALPQPTTAADVAAWETMAGTAGLLWVGALAVGVLLAVPAGWFLIRHATSQLQVRGEDGSGGRLAVEATGTPGYLAKWVAICLLTGGAGVLFYPAKALTRALNHARAGDGDVPHT